MMRLHTLCAWAIAVLLAGCGSSTEAPAAYQGPPLIAAKPDAIVTLDAKSHLCVVALSNEQQGNSIPCDDVVPFLKDELRMAPGSIYDIHADQGADPAQLARLSANLKSAGYRFIGGHEER
jgi:hypothetical protein